MNYLPPSRQARECKYWWFDGWDWLVNQALRACGSPRVDVSPGEIAVDPHIHTLYSHCSISQPAASLLAAARVGMGAVGVMDHHHVRGAIETMRCADELKRLGALPEDFLVIPGVELNSDIGHVGALFVTADLPEGLSPARTVEAIHQAGGVAVAVHPYHSTGIGDAVFDGPFDAVEVECGSVFDSGLVRRNRELADDPRLASIARIGASDAHYRNAVASCYTVLTLAEPSLEAAKRAILAGRSVARSSEPLRRVRRLLGLVPKLR